MGSRLIKSIKFGLRWSIAIGGMTWVIASMSFRDRVLFLDAQSRPVEARIIESDEAAGTFHVIDPRDQKLLTVNQSQLISPPDAQSIDVQHPDGTIQPMHLLGLDLSPGLKRVDRLLVAPDAHAPGEWVTPDQTQGYELRVPRPLVQTGVYSMVRQANLPLLLGAIFVFPLTFILCAFRWHALLRVLDISISQSKAFILTMVGSFYNTFMPGSTGGDLLKAIYAARFTQYKTRAVVSVFVDRVVGLVALVILGGAMAGYYTLTHWGADPTVRSTLKVGLACIVVLLGCGISGVVLYIPVLRKYSGMGWLLSHLPLQKHVQQALETMVILSRRPWLMAGAVAVTLPVHGVVVLSAMLAGLAFGLPLQPMYYWVVVPVVVLVAAMPISPQGAGVMEAFAIALTRSAGASVSEAVALTMSIRTVQVLWNLTGGFWVLRGGYRAPSTDEQSALELEDLSASTVPANS